MFHTLHLMQHAHFLKYITVISPKAAPKGIYNCLIGDLMLASGEKKNETDIHALAAWKHNKFKVCFQRQIVQLGWNQNTNFLPEASIGLRVLSSPGFVCVCVSVNFFVRAITHHTFQLESSNLDPKIQQILLKVPIVFGVDWPWPSRSNLTSFQNSVYLHHFCILKYLWDLHKNGSFLNCFPAQMIPHIYRFQYTRWHGRATHRESV